MNEIQLKHIIALLLEDAERIQQVEPNAGTAARIWLAKETLSDCVKIAKFNISVNRPD